MIITIAFCACPPLDNLGGDDSSTEAKIPYRARRPNLGARDGEGRGGRGGEEGACMRQVERCMTQVERREGERYSKSL